MTIAEAAVQTGWYFYGITRQGSLEVPADFTPVQLLEFSGLAAVVRPVMRDDFSLQAMQERLKNASALEAMVLSHNRVIEAIHAQQAILPAKFGIVYADRDDVVSALRTAHDTLQHQLHEIEGSDEWAVHVFADAAVIEERTSREDAAIRRLQDERATARPGRAYFLDQLLQDELKAATSQALETVAQNAFDRLSGCAIASQMGETETETDLAGEVEILRSSFLVTRAGADHFTTEVNAITEVADGLRCEFSGPWPPYSFAARYVGEAQ